MTKPNPWAPPQFTGPVFGGPLTGTDLQHDQERKDIFVLDQLVGFYTFLDGQWLYTPIDAT